MKISEILAAIEYEQVYNLLDINIENFTNDSSVRLEKSLYLGIKGVNHNGGNFYKESFENGAVCAIVEDINIDEQYLKNNNKCIILVKSVLKSLDQLARYKRSICNIPIIAITASAGKTSTKDLLHASLSEKYSVYKTPGNKNNEIGLPMSLLNIKNEQIAILEMGMDHLGEISYLTNLVKPNIAVICNIGTAHIGNLGSKENILKAKLEILEGLDKDGIVVINNDDELLSKWYIDNKDKYNVLSYGINNESNIIAKNIETKSLESSFEVECVKVCVPIPGIQYISNSLAAILVSKVFKLNINEISKGIKNVELSSNRMDIIVINDITIINDTYNANLDAMVYGIKNLSTFNGRRIACLGDMLELGDFSTSIHKQLGESINVNDIDLLITVGTESKNVHTEVLKKGIEAIHFNNNNDAIKYINENKKSGDIYMIKASQGCKFIDIVNEISK